MRKKRSKWMLAGTGSGTQAKCTNKTSAIEEEEEESGDSKADWLAVSDRAAGFF